MQKHLQSFHFAMFWGSAGISYLFGVALDCIFYGVETPVSIAGR
jgi:hypothetical protein